MITRREVRLGTGLVLFTYVSVHFVDHALGLYSVDVAEQALKVAVAVWQSAVGTTLLYGAAAIHIALAFIAVYERRTLRMPPVQALRIALGFGMPLLLIGHVVATRLAAELYGLSPTYTRVVWALWTSDSEGRQLALLAPGWVHGCLGIDFAFGRRALYQRIRPMLFGAALLLPVLAALGFLAMGRELAALSVIDPAWQTTAEVADTAQRIALGRLRDGLLFGYLALIGLVFAARALRDRIERRNNALVPIAYPDRTIEVPRGWSILEASRGFGIPHLSMCGGNARCSTCRVRVVSGLAQCPPPSPNEQRTLERIGAAAGRPPRLPAATHGARSASCRCSTPAQPRMPDARRRHRRSNAWSRSCSSICLAGPDRDRTHSPHDEIYASNLALAAIGAAIADGGGVCLRSDAEGAIGVFGIAIDPTTACAQAIDAARVIEQHIAALNARLTQRVRFRRRCRARGPRGTGGDRVDRIRADARASGRRSRAARCAKAAQSRGGRGPAVYCLRFGAAARGADGS